MTETPLTDFEKQLSALAEPVIYGSKTGYQWKEVDNLLESELAKHTKNTKTRCKKANGSGRGANVLTESNDKDIDLYLIFVISPYTAEQFALAASIRMRRFPKIQAVAIADEINGEWRVRSLLANHTSGVAEAARKIFPGITANTFTVIDTGSTSTSPDRIPEVAQFDPDSFEADIAGLEAPETPTRAVADAFVEHCGKMGIALDLTVAIDILACCLSGQQVIFAGPSGTGKSAVSSCLRTFLAGSGRSVTIEASRGWTGPEDIVGYYSSITSTFAHTANTAALIDLHESTLAGLAGGDATPPFFTVEEANLSSVEGYLSPVVHAFGGSDSEMIAWHLHAQHDQVPDPEDQITVPPMLAMGPYPRVLMTINVDSNSPAPARKVTSRGAVVLMEPLADPDPVSIAEQLALRANLAARAPYSAAPTHSIGEAANYIGRPSSIRLAYDTAGGSIAEVVTDFFAYIDSISSVNILPSSRETEQVTNFVCAFELLCSRGSVETIPQSLRTIALENALMHFILPRLDPEDFGMLMEDLAESLATPTFAMPIEYQGIASLIRSRVDRLTAATRSQGLSGMADFWTALS